MSQETTNGDNKEELVLTPWEVKGDINYGKLMQQFGCQPLTSDLVERLERITGRLVHPLIKRGFVYCHRDFDQILALHEQGKPFYLYTGRGPSSESMHLGHMVPFVLCKYLQDAFQCPLVIQLTDDEKFLVKDNLTVEDTRRFALENAKDIIAVGFDPKRTFIFADFDYIGTLYPTVCQVQKCINNNQVRAVFGIGDFDNIGKTAFPAVQIAPSFSQTFPHIFGGDRLVPCLIPYAIDQDPYFRVCRDVAPRLKLLKPASLCSQFFPALQGPSTKMSASQDTSAIFMTDDEPRIQTKINKHSFSGGGDTLELHRQHGANLSADVAFQYLRFFLEDDEELGHIAREYGAGRMLTGQVKARCIQVLTKFVQDFQGRRALVTDDIVCAFMAVRPMPRSS
jgi:tryptophanyl-tRNA synthetase